MLLSLDLQEFVEYLEDAPETKELEEEEMDVNAYLLYEVLPLLEQEIPLLLTEIDFNQFEEYDPARLFHYVETVNRHRWKIQGLATLIQRIPPALRPSFV